MATIIGNGVEIKLLSPKYLKYTIPKKEINARKTVDSYYKKASPADKKLIDDLRSAGASELEIATNLGK